MKNSRFFSLQPELVYVRRGFRLQDKSQPFTLRERYDYLDLPFLVRYTRQGFFGEIGPQLGYLLHNRTHVEEGLVHTLLFAAVALGV